MVSLPAAVFIDVIVVVVVVVVVVYVKLKNGITFERLEIST